VLFDLSDDQAEFRDSVRGMLSRQMTPAMLRAVWDADGAGTRDLWRRLAEMGVQGMVVPDQYGGVGGSHVELALAMEEIGYHGVPDPVLETAFVAASTLAHCGDQTVRDRWLPAIAAGEAVVSLSLDEPALVVHGAQADAVLVTRGTQTHLVPADRAAWRPVATQDPTRRLALGDFQLDDSTLLADDAAVVDRVTTAARTASAAVLVGVSRRLVDMTIGYVLEREQFGQVIGSFQALKHRLADSAVIVEAARSLTWYAAYAFGHEPAAATWAARVAKSAASDAGATANAAALQLHGGIGFTWEHDLHLWLKRGQALQHAYGSATDHRVAVGARILDRNAPALAG
jgi:alkylation response protein AidB-like acyl-CoA dehydrogenase